MVAEALVGVEAVAWLRAWAGMSMEAKEGLLDNSERERTRYVAVLCFYKATCDSWITDTHLNNGNINQRALNNMTTQDSQEKASANLSLVFTSHDKDVHKLVFFF